MGRVSGVPAALAIQLGSAPTSQPDGARTTFPLPTGQTAKPGSVAAYRKPAAVAAPAAYAGVDVAAVGPAQVALLSELNDLRAVVDALRAIINRSYLRDDPQLWGYGEDVALGIVPTVIAGVASNPQNATDGNDATYAGGENSRPSFVFDLGKPMALSRIALRGRQYPGGTSGTLRDVTIRTKLANADPWTLNVVAKQAPNGQLFTTALPLPGPWRFVNVDYQSSQTNVWGRYETISIIGGEDITQLLYDAAPASGERLLLDYSRED